MSNFTNLHFNNYNIAENAIQLNNNRIYYGCLSHIQNDIKGAVLF